jgi:hypothetical protein
LTDSGPYVITTGSVSPVRAPHHRITAPKFHILALIWTKWASNVSKRNSATPVKHAGRTPVFRHIADWDTMSIDHLGRTRRNHIRIDFTCRTSSFLASWNESDVFTSAAMLRTV